MRGETGDLAISSKDILTEAISPEKQQEQELMGKLASTGKLPARPASSFLQKKLQQRKFFDSGDYAMDKSKASNLSSKPHPLAGIPQTNNQQTRKTIATTVNTKPSPCASPVTPTLNRPSAERVDEDSLQIPRPDTVPQRKASIINPAVHCKLSPLPHVQHHHDVTTSSTSNE